jgi:hypothetical protein
VKSGQPKSLLVDLTQHSWDLFVPKGARLTAGPFPFCPLNGAGAAWSLPATQLPWNIKPSVELLPRVSYSHSPPRTKCIAHVRSSGAAPSRLGLSRYFLARGRSLPGSLLSVMAPCSVVWSAWVVREFRARAILARKPDCRSRRLGLDP